MTGRAYAMHEADRQHWQSTGSLDLENWTAVTAATAASECDGAEIPHGDGWEPLAAPGDGDLAINPRGPQRVITASALMRMELPEPRFVVLGIISEGLTILAARPKI